MVMLGILGTLCVWPSLGQGGPRSSWEPAQLTQKCGLGICDSLSPLSGSHAPVKATEDLLCCG